MSDDEAQSPQTFGWRLRQVEHSVDRLSRTLQTTQTAVIGLLLAILGVILQHQFFH